MPRFDILGEGFVCKRDPKGLQPVAAGSRVVVAAGGELVCSYMVQQKLGLNDFFPVVARSGDGGKTWTEQGPICVAVSPGFAASGSYPSGHAASAWLYALLLAEVDSEHAAAIVARGRVFGESRVVCGVHYASDVEAGRITATALVAALHGNADFDADMAAARAEIADARPTAPRPDAASCPTPNALASPW